jgi:hypothetical protein
LEALAATPLHDRAIGRIQSAFEEEVRNEAAMRSIERRFSSDWPLRIYVRGSSCQVRTFYDGGGSLTVCGGV